MVPTISKLVHVFTDKYFAYLVVLAAISLYGIYYNVKKYKFNTEYFLFLYITSFCYLYCTSAIRFFCAFSIILVSFNYMIKKDDLKVWLMVILASMFHTSAIVFLPIYYMTKSKFLSRNIVFTMILLSFIILLNQIIGMRFLLNFSYFQKYSYVFENQNS